MEACQPGAGHIAYFTVNECQPPVTQAVEVPDDLLHAAHIIAYDSRAAIEGLLHRNHRNLALRQTADVFKIIDALGNDHPVALAVHSVFIVFYP